MQITLGNLSCLRAVMILINRTRRQFELQRPLLYFVVQHVCWSCMLRITFGCPFWHMDFSNKIKEKEKMMTKKMKVEYKSHAHVLQQWSSDGRIEVGIVTITDDPELLSINPPKRLEFKLLGEGNLKVVGHMFGPQPVIEKDGLTAYLFPGEQTDALDGAPYIASGEKTYDLSPEHWKIIDARGVEMYVEAINKAEKRIEIAKKYSIRNCQHYEKFPED